MQSSPKKGNKKKKQTYSLLWIRAYTQASCGNADNITHKNKTKCEPFMVSL